MSQYNAPLRDMHFVMKELAGLEQVVQLPGYEEVDTDLSDAILEEASKFAGNVLSPINFSGDQEGSKWHDKAVTVPAGFKEAYTQFAENGWTALACSPEFGGQGLPKLISTAVNEMWKSANMAFSLCPMLTTGAIEALMTAGSDALKQKFLPKMVSGEWTGTMNLTEPSAGSDLAAVRTRAEPQGDGSYKIFGQKIFITYGDHNMTENIVHLVLARLPNAPEGVKGISLFVVPKFMVKDDGSLGERNDAYCVSIEHKLGIHASPTAVMAFGDHGGAVGYLVGEENRGLEYMFIMMNAARFAVGMEGVALAERAYQQAVWYAKDRIQGTELGVRGGPKVSILKHPDVRRLLMSMRSQTEAARALAYVVAAAMDAAKHHPDEAVRAANQAFADLMIPVVKGHSTEMSIEVASEGVQVHGGMGFIEETGAAQYMRAARIITIYEGTTAIQANDLIGRKTAKEGGKSMQQLLADIAETASALRASDNAQLKGIADALGDGIAALDEATNWLIANYDANPQAAAAGSVPFLKLTGIVVGGWLMARSAAIAAERLDAADGDFYKAKIGTATYFAQHVIPEANSYRDAIVGGAESVLALEEALF